jgi:hypothetical protein
LHIIIFNTLAIIDIIDIVLPDYIIIENTDIRHWHYSHIMSQPHYFYLLITFIYADDIDAIIDMIFAFHYWLLFIIIDIIDYWCHYWWRLLTLLAIISIIYFIIDIDYLFDIAIIGWYYCHWCHIIDIDYIITPLLMTLLTLMITPFIIILLIRHIDDIYDYAIDDITPLTLHDIDDTLIFIDYF